MFPPPRPIPFRSLVLGLIVSGTLACASGGRWGHTRNYTPYKDEKSNVEDAKDLDAPMAQLKPEAWKGVKVRFFMVVDVRKPGPGGAAYLTGKQHTLNEINACENKYDDESCRVTIKPTGHDTVHALVKLVGDDDVGELHVGVGSLVRVVGTPSDKTDEEDGKLVIQASWYRQWPANYYVKEGDLKQ